MTTEEERVPPLAKAAAPETMESPDVGEAKASLNPCSSAAAVARVPYHPPIQEVPSLDNDQTSVATSGKALCFLR